MDKVKRATARELFLSGALSSNAAIARHVQTKPHTIARWRVSEKWDAMLAQIETLTDEQLMKRLATDRAELHERYFRLWNAVINGNYIQLAHKVLDKV